MIRVTRTNSTHIFHGWVGLSSSFYKDYLIELIKFNYNLNYRIVFKKYFNCSFSFQTPLYAVKSLSKHNLLKKKIRFQQIFWEKEKEEEEKSFICKAQTLHTHDNSELKPQKEK